MEPETSKTNYGRLWEHFYRQTYDRLKTKSLWEVPSERSVGVDWEIYQHALDPTLPLLDLGCGTGGQAAWLRKKYSRVIGVDVAPTAIEMAQERYLQEGLSFYVYDITNPAATEKLCRNLGGAVNLYIRGVLHQVRSEDRENARSAILSLLGTKGTMYCVEVADHIRKHLQEEVTSFSDLPQGIRRALISNLPPRGFSLTELSTWFPEEQFNIIDSGATFLATNLELPNGKLLEIPAVYALIRPNTTLEST